MKGILFNRDGLLGFYINKMQDVLCFESTNPGQKNAPTEAPGCGLTFLMVPLHLFSVKAWPSLLQWPMNARTPDHDHEEIIGIAFHRSSTQAPLKVLKEAKNVLCFTNNH